jgi:hypothetical protein
LEEDTNNKEATKEATKTTKTINSNSLITVKDNSRGTTIKTQTTDRTEEISKATTLIENTNETTNTTPKVISISLNSINPTNKTSHINSISNIPNNNGEETMRSNHITVETPTQTEAEEKRITNIHKKTKITIRRGITTNIIPLLGVTGNSFKMTFRHHNKPGFKSMHLSRSNLNQKSQNQLLSQHHPLHLLRPNPSQPNFPFSKLSNSSTLLTNRNCNSTLILR